MKKHIAIILCGILFSFALYICLLLFCSDEFINKIGTFITDTSKSLKDYYIAMIGVYIAVMILLATSRTPASSRIIEKGLFNKLSLLVSFAMGYSIVAIIVISLNISATCYLIIQAVLSIIAIIYSICFMVLTVQIFNYNTQKLEENTIEEDKNNNYRQVVFEELYEWLKKHRNK